MTADETSSRHDPRKELEVPADKISGVVVPIVWAIA
jgi:hypothetical protein